MDFVVNETRAPARDSARIFAERVSMPRAAVSEWASADRADVLVVRARADGAGCAELSAFLVEGGAEAAMALIAGSVLR